jgi:hypothetical protein
MTKLMEDPGIAIETHHMFWTNNFFMGACGTAEKYAEEAIALYDPDRDHSLTYNYSGHDPGVCSQCVSGLAAWHRGALDHAAERCQGALALAERLSHPLTTALAYWGLAYLAMFRREAETTLAWAQKEIAISKQIESLLRSAVHTAAEQNAPLPALRAATSLARFLSSQQRRAEAHAVLQPHATLIASLAGTQDATWAAEFA